MVQREDMIYHIHISYVWLLFLQLGSQEFSSKEVLPFVQRHSEPRRRFARCVRAHGTARSMRDKAEETMSRERSHAAFVVLSCSAVLLTLLGVVGISRSVLASSVGPAAARGSAALGDAPARLGVARTAHARRCADVRIVGAGIVPRAASEDGEWWLGYPLGEQVDDVPTHYSHIMRNFVPSVLRCTAVNGPGACYNVHLPLARLKSAGKDALVEAVTAEVASLVNNATVTFVDSGEDRVSGHAGGKVSRASSTSSARARGALGVGVRRAGPGRTRPPPTASGDSPPGDSPPGDSPPGDSPPGDSHARMCKADDTSATALYSPLRRVAAANAEYWGERCADAPEVVHLVRGDVDAIARDADVPNVEHLTDDELLARKVRAVTNPAEVDAFLRGWAAKRGWRFGRVVADGMSVTAQRRAFCNARVVFGMHGAGLINVLWAGGEGRRWLIDVPPGDDGWFGEVCDVNGVGYVRSTTGHLTKDASYATKFEGDAVALVGWTRVNVRGLERDMERAGVGVEEDR